MPQSKYEIPSIFTFFPTVSNKQQINKFATRHETSHGQSYVIFMPSQMLRNLLFYRQTVENLCAFLSFHIQLLYRSDVPSKEFYSRYIITQ